MGQGGNIWEFMETMEGKCRGGSYVYGYADLRSSRRGDIALTTAHPRTGLRLVAIPEPTTTVMLLTGLCGLLGFYRWLSIRERAAWQYADDE
jgi:hypothetical protein